MSRCVGVRAGVRAGALALFLLSVPLFQRYLHKVFAKRLRSIRCFEGYVLLETRVVWRMSCSITPAIDLTLCSSGGPQRLFSCSFFSFGVRILHAMFFLSTRLADFYSASPRQDV